MILSNHHVISRADCLKFLVVATCRHSREAIHLRISRLSIYRFAISQLSLKFRPKSLRIQQSWFVTQRLILGQKWWLHEQPTKKLINPLSPTRRSTTVTSYTIHYPHSVNQHSWTPILTPNARLCDLTCVIAARMDGGKPRAIWYPSLRFPIQIPSKSRQCEKWEAFIIHIKQNWHVVPSSIISKNTSNTDIFRYLTFKRRDGSWGRPSQWCWPSPRTWPCGRCTL